MGRDFYYFLDPPDKRTDCFHDREYLHFDVSRHNSVLHSYYYDSRTAQTKKELIEKIQNLSASLSEEEFRPWYGGHGSVMETLEAIKVYCAVIESMEDSDTVWLNYQ
jgi:hypothetical protein